MGEYEHPAYGTCKVLEENGRLRWEWSSFKKDLEPYRGDVFEIHDDVLRDPLVTFVVEKERVAKMRNDVRKERDAIAALRAEWATLDNPARLQGLVHRHLKLGPVQPAQFDNLDIHNLEKLKED